MQPYLAELEPNDARASMRTGVDRRAVVLHALAGKDGMLHAVLDGLGFLDDVSRSDLQTALPKLREMFRPPFLAEASRMSELSKSDVLLALLDQLRFVSMFVLSDEDSVERNVAAATQLIKQGRVNLFLP